MAEACPVDRGAGDVEAEDVEAACIKLGNIVAEAAADDDGPAAWADQAWCVAVEPVEEDVVGVAVMPGDAVGVALGLRVDAFAILGDGEWADGLGVRHVEFGCVCSRGMVEGGLRGGLLWCGGLKHEHISLRGAGVCCMGRRAGFAVQLAVDAQGLRGQRVDERTTF